MGLLPLLSVENLRITTSGGTPVVDGVSFWLNGGEFLGIVGESGSGKTMIARMILRLLPEGIQIGGGRILFDGEDLAAASPRRLQQLRGAAIGLVFQEPLVSLNPAMTIGSQIIEAMSMHQRQTRAALRRRAVEMLERVRIRDPERSLNSYPHEFSGGMRQRIMLAAVMITRPKLLIADEPTTALDTISQRQILDLMTELAQESGTAVVLITHNLGLVAHYTQRTVVLSRGRVIEQGSTEQILYAPAESDTRNLVAALPQRTNRRSPSVNRQAVVTIRGLDVIYKARRMLFRRTPAVSALTAIDLDIHDGEMLALVGDSGSGKTTLGRTVLGLVEPAAGEVKIRGISLQASDRRTRRGIRLMCQMVFQDPHSSLDPRLRIGDIVGEALRHRPDLPRAERRKRVGEILEQVGLGGYEMRFPHSLSGGQRQRVAIARAIVPNPVFIVADEPVSALDMTIQSQVLSLLRRLQVSHGFACLFISHDLGAVEQIADRVVVMKSGRVIEEGSCDDIFDRPQHAYTRALLGATLSLLPSNTTPHLALHQEE